MKWDGKYKKCNSVCYNKIFERNLRKIINAKTNTVYVIFPYNQMSLLVPNNKFWLEMVENMDVGDLLICSPNALARTWPLISEKNHLITVNEMVLRYWEEIQIYLKANPKIKNIVVISSDINISRIKRDFLIVLQKNGHNFNVEYNIIAVCSSFWKIIYRIREAIVFQLPIRWYRFLGSFFS
jgi:hypothetical protein